MTYDLGVFQAVTYALDLRARASVHHFIVSGFSIPYSSVVLLDLFTLTFKTRCFGGSSLWCWTQELGCQCGTQSLNSLKESCICLESLLIVDCCSWSGVLGKTISLPLLPLLMHLFDLLLWRPVHRAFRCFSEENYSISSSKFVVYGTRWVQDLPASPLWTQFLCVSLLLLHNNTPQFSNIKQY